MKQCCARSGESTSKPNARQNIKHMDTGEIHQCHYKCGFSCQLTGIPSDAAMTPSVFQYVNSVGFKSTAFSAAFRI